MQEAKGSAQEKNLDAKVILAFRRRNEDQIDQLVRAMGFDPADPGVWKRAFFNLAVIHWGVGHLSWTPPLGSNRRAAKWTVEHDSAFYLLMQELMAKGKKQTAALREIANDPKKWKLFPKPRESTVRNAGPSGAL